MPLASTALILGDLQNDFLERPGVVPPPLWGDPHVVQERLAGRVRDVRFDRATMVVSALSPQHQRETLERTAGPVIRLIEMLAATDPVKLAAYRDECEALIAEYFHDNVVRQGYVMTRATKL